MISWALVLALPAMATLALLSLPPSFGGIDALAWTGLAYVTLFSMLIGFVFWYRGLFWYRSLALRSIAAVGQLQLLQPFFSLALAALLLREPVNPAMLAVAAILLCVWGAKRFAR